MSNNGARAKDDPSNISTTTANSISSSNDSNEEISIRKSQRERKPSNRFRDVTDDADDDNDSKQPPVSKGVDEAKDVASAVRIRMPVKSERDSQDFGDGKRLDDDEEEEAEKQVRVSIRAESKLMSERLVAMVPCRPASSENTLASEDQGVDNEVKEQGLIIKPPLTKLTPERNRCRYNGCTKYRQSHTGGFCLTHKHFGVTAVEPVASANVIPPFAAMLSATASFSRERDDVVTPMPERNRCKFAGCLKYKQSHTGGYCHTHRHCGVPTLGGTAYPTVPDVAVKEEVHQHHGPDVEIKVRIRTKYNICEGYTHAVIDQWVYDSVWQRLGLKATGDRKDPPENHFDGRELINGFIMSRQHLCDMDAKPAASSNFVNHQDDVIDDGLMSSVDAYAMETDTAQEIPNDVPPLEDKQRPHTSSHPLLLANLPPGISISSTPPKNARGRSICKVNGCTKLDQSNNHGFCRSHYNLLVNEEYQDDGTTGGPWTCQCGLLVGAKQKRCGVCFRWKGGTRDTYIVNGKKTEGRAVTATAVEAMPLLTAASWTCECGNHVEEHKSRCGKCHHWRGGKRQGGWKLGAKLTVAAELEEDGIDRSTDWRCCGEVISAQKTRCGKCRGWRGGKRKVRWTYDGGPRVKKAAPPPRDVREEGDNVDSSIEWECKKCNNVNQGTKKRCAKCASWRFSRKKLRMSAPYSSSGRGHRDAPPSTKTSGHWICQSCSFDNFSTEIKCLMCQMLRPNWQKYSDSMPVDASDSHGEHEGIFQSNSFADSNNAAASARHHHGGGVAAASAVSNVHGFSNCDAVGSLTTSSRGECSTSAMENLSHAAQIDCDHLLSSIGPLHDAPMNEFGLLHNQGNYSKPQNFHNSLNDNSGSFHINGTDDHFLDSHVDDSMAFGNHPGVGSTFSNPSYLTANSLHGGSNDYIDGNNVSNYGDAYSHYDNLIGGDATATAGYVQSNSDGASGFEINTSDESKVTENIVQV
ncbi:hypothetical protein HJC23_000593 [Cyclotella cryptica]|uniref:RanBP2-type domain-containing protein n=1 Tax=Cyclotella cryptica TaxID=29204 RepID=A0ABD3PGC3_9STRA|eukprot:CCRYP_015280-RA/>CCRYP_015280-RA protein AED:0.00 eAED:0.00 QI:263/-1/1/1/-1/1/1/201/977